MSLIIKPFLKWVGGKMQLIHSIIKTFPTEFNNYHEFFLGGGSVLIYLLQLRNEKKITIHKEIFAYDVNKGLINTYKQLQRNKNLLIQCLDNVCTTFKSIPLNTHGQIGKPVDISKNTCMHTREHYYYWIRQCYNSSSKDSVESATYFIFLNKTCFRGLYREGPSGFNVPYGLKDKKKIPTIFQTTHLEHISKLFEDVTFLHMDFKDSFKRVKKNDFIYVDPPYLPENKSSFTDYVKNGFLEKEHQTLFDCLLSCKEKQIRFTMSNSNVTLLKQKFKEYRVEEVKARRAIHSRNPGAVTTELLIF